MINVMLAVSLLIITILWVVIVLRDDRREDKIWNVVEILKWSVDMNHERAEKEAEKVKQCEAALVDMDTLRKQDAEKHKEEMKKLRSELDTARQAFSDRYNEVQKLTSELKSVRSVMEGLRCELKTRDKELSEAETAIEGLKADLKQKDENISKLEATIDDLRIREEHAIKAGALAARLSQAIKKDKAEPKTVCQCPEGADPKYTYKQGGFYCLCSDKKMVPDKPIPASQKAGEA